MEDILYIAHRGLHNKNVPENSLMAIKRAVDANIAVEIDIQLTKDNKVVVFHDENLKRLTGYDSSINNLTYEEISKLYLNNTLEKIPLLEDVLKIVQGKVLLDIEIKHYHHPIKSVICISKILRHYYGDYYIKSFNPMIPKLYKKKNSNIHCGVLVGSYSKRFPKFLKWILVKGKYLWWYNPDFVCYNLNEITDDLIEKFKSANILIYTYGIKSKKDLIKVQKFSKAIIYDSIEKIR